MNELLFHSGRVRTFDPAQPFAEAVAVRGDTIVAVGDVGDVRREVSPRAESVDLSGGLLIPGIRDAHVHPVHGGIDLLSCDLSGVTMDAQAYVAAVARYAAERPELPWITGGGWSMTAFPGGTPRADLLDVAVSDRPCYLVNTDRHGAWVNTNALRLAGLDRDVTDPSDGRIERDRDGAPTGTLHEGAARLVGDLTPPLGADDCLAALLIAQRHLHALGITGWQDAIVGEYLGYPDNFEAYRTLDARGDLTASVTGALWWDRTLGTEQIPTLVERRALAESCDRFRATSVKIMVDGVVETQTASMLEPYGGGHHPGSSGTPFIEREALASAVAVLDSAGFQVHLHTIGDRAVRDALDAIGALPDPRRGRHQLAHIQVVDPADVPRFGALGVVANVQMLWASNEPQMTELTVPLLGARRATQQYPFASLRRSGAVLAAGSDWPVSSADPMQQVHVGVSRTPVDGHVEPFLPAERLSVDAALGAFVVGSAFADRREPNRGVLRAGMLADLTVLDRDVYDIAAAELGAVGVRHTFVDGRCCWDAG